MSDPPLLSIGIPLYKARPFYDTIVENIDSIEYPNVEFLISDRHLADDTIDRLEERYRGDSRIRIFRHNDNGDWWDNYDFLLHTATGDYFRWLPQDDLLPRHGLDKLVTRMEEDREIILAYHRIDNIDAEGTVLVSEGHHDVKRATKGLSRRWGFRDAWLIAARIHHQAAGIGLIRRATVIEHDLHVRPNRGGLGMLAFRYALACRGRFEMVPEVVGLYRWHPGNYTSYSPTRWSDYRDYHVNLKAYSPSTSWWHRPLRSIALMAAAFVSAPGVLFVWYRTPKGRRARKAMGWK